VGEHAGVANFTVGQRRGLPGGVATPRYVTRIDAATNTIVIGGAEELTVAGLIADEVNIIRPEHFGERPARVHAMTRYRSRPFAATAALRADATLELAFDEPQRAVTPGQLVALFAPDGDEVYAAATIRETL
jgi:tRNA-specific 2-thiouridylase